MLPDGGEKIIEERIETINADASLRAVLHLEEVAGYIPSRRPEPQPDITVNNLTRIQRLTTAELEEMLIETDRKIRLLEGNSDDAEEKPP